MNASTILRHRILKILLLGTAAMSVGCGEGEGEDHESAYLKSLPKMPENNTFSAGMCGGRECVALGDDGICHDDYIRTGESGDDGCCATDLHGPYHAEESGESPCCYFVETELCEGRPFFVGQENRQAPVIARTDWC